MSIIIGIDNGVTGSIAIMQNGIITLFEQIPTIFQQDYTKTKKNITRVDGVKLLFFLADLKIAGNKVICILERPMINPVRFRASISASRCLEAELIILEHLKIPYLFIDSKEWQKQMLPQGKKEKDELKKLSMDIGIRLFPQFKEKIVKQKDADSLLIAEYYNRNCI